MPPEITIFLFLEWLNQEVQSVIWQKLFKYKYCMRAIISWSFYTFIPFFITVLPKNVFHLFTVRLKILYQSISRDKNLVVIKLVRIKIIFIICFRVIRINILKGNYWVLGIGLMGRCQKLGIILESKVIKKLMLSKYVNNKKCAPELIFFNEKWKKWERFR